MEGILLPLLVSWSNGARSLPSNTRAGLPHVSCEIGGAMARGLVFLLACGAGAAAFTMPHEDLVEGPGARDVLNDPLEEHVVAYWAVAFVGASVTLSLYLPHVALIRRAPPTRQRRYFVSTTRWLIRCPRTYAPGTQSSFPCIMGICLSDRHGVHVRRGRWSSQFSRSSSPSRLLWLWSLSAQISC
jgi:hypothetical protein